MTKNKTVVFYLKKEYYLNQYFNEIIEGISNEGYSIVLLHYSSISVDVKRTLLPNEVTSIDISYKRIVKIIKLIKEINPILIVFSGYRNLFDFSMTAISKSLEIPIMQIEHGIVIPVERNSSNLHYIRFLYSYIILGIKLLFNFLIFKHTFFQFINQKKGLYTFDFLLLYSEYSAEVMSYSLSTKNSKIIYAGYPIAFDEKELKKLCKIESKKQIVYIHQPLVEDGLLEISLEKFIFKIHQLGIECKRFGYSFKVKLHPRAYVKYYKSVLDEFIYDGELSTSSLIAESEIIIGHFSSALAIALYLKKPVIKLQFPEFKIDGDDVFDDYVSLVHNIDDFNKNINDLTSIDSLDITQLIGHNNTHEFRVNKFIEILNSIYE